jgi:hypothetical protein
MMRALRLSLLLFFTSWPQILSLAGRRSFSWRARRVFKPCIALFDHPDKRSSWKIVPRYRQISATNCYY